MITTLELSKKKSSPEQTTGRGKSTMSMQEKQAARKNKKNRSALEPRQITRAMTNIRLSDANAGKLAALYVGVRYETAWWWFKAGKIRGKQLESGTIVVTEELDQHSERELTVVVYARVSANEHRPNLERQAERLCAYCAAKGWKVHKVVKEVGSGVNDSRRKLLTSKRYWLSRDALSKWSM
jgi:hypothetical protein